MLALAHEIPGLDGRQASDAWDADDLRIVLGVPIPCPADGSGRVASTGTSSASNPAGPVEPDRDGSRFFGFDASRLHSLIRPESIERPPRSATN